MVKLKNPAHEFSRIVREHFASVQPEEFEDRLHDASHGEFGKKKNSDDSPKDVSPEDISGNT